MNCLSTLKLLTNASLPFFLVFLVSCLSTEASSTAPVLFLVHHVKKSSLSCGRASSSFINNNDPLHKNKSILTIRYRRNPTKSIHSAQDMTTSLKMCQLMGMNCATLTDFSFSLRGFTRRGGATDVHSHGWGLCFYDGMGLRSFHDPDPAAESLLAEFLQSHPVKTLNVVAHIRYATRGEVKLENVHPFSREMWGCNFCFAHNGDVSLFDRNLFQKSNNNIKHSQSINTNPNDNQSKTRTSIPQKMSLIFSSSYTQIPWIGKSIGVEDPGIRYYNPIGATDSETMFCAILNALRARFDTLPTLPVLHAALSALCNEIVTRDKETMGGNTILNFLLGCGPHLQFAYSWPGAREGSEVWNGLHYLVREPPFGSAHLSDCDYSIDFSAVAKEDDRVAVIATSPLTDDEDWVEFERGQLILFDDGVPHMAPEDCEEVEFRNHGLVSSAIPAAPSLEVDMRRYRLRTSFFEGSGI
mmetsp:Transcript_13049/g.26828  ORF Transcript_13049/g.26828 Transcript_13049/m.26828 type:complete len:470 (-) Transcript_13049:140-1549(-)